MTIDSTGATVASDMQRVFSGLSDAARPLPRSRSLERAPVRHRRGFPRWALLIAAILFAGWAALTLLRPAERASSSSIHQPRALARPVSPPPIAPRAVPAPVAQVPAPAVEVAASDQPATSAPRHASTKKATATAKSSPTRPRRAEPARSRSASATSGEALDAPLCRNARDPDLCLRREVIGADRRLRRAYANALDSPLKTSELAKVRRGWDKALSRSEDEPLVSIRALDGMTTSLYNEIETARSDDSRDD